MKASIPHWQELKICILTSAPDSTGLIYSFLIGQHFFSIKIRLADVRIDKLTEIQRKYKNAQHT